MGFMVQGEFKIGLELLCTLPVFDGRFRVVVCYLFGLFMAASPFRLCDVKSSGFAVQRGGHLRNGVLSLGGFRADL